MASPGNNKENALLIFISYIKSPSRTNYVYNNEKIGYIHFSNRYMFLQLVVDIISFHCTQQRGLDQKMSESQCEITSELLIDASSMNHFLETSNKNSTFRFKDH